MWDNCKNRKTPIVDFKNILIRLSKKQYISPKYIRKVAIWYCAQNNYSLGMLYGHAFKNNRWMSRGIPEQTGVCFICAKPLFEDKKICTKDICIKVWGWWLHTPNLKRIIPKYVEYYSCIEDFHKSRNEDGKFGVWLLIKFLLFLTKHKRYRRKHHDRRKRKANEKN